MLASDFYNFKRGIFISLAITDLRFFDQFTRKKYKPSIFCKPVLFNIYFYKNLWYYMIRWVYRPILSAIIVDNWNFQKEENL